MEQRLAHGGPRVLFKTYKPSVPRQSIGSNDCGLFVLEFAERVYGDHKNFLKKAEDNNLQNWFKPSLINTRREELAMLIRQLSEEQRKPGGVLEGVESVVLPDFTPRNISRGKRRTKLNQSE